MSKRFGAQAAVAELSFAVEHGSFFSILGPSGCGKTTLLRMVAGFIAPDSGEIRIGGQSMAGLAPNRRPVNMVFQHLALFPMMTVGDNVGYGLARRGLPRTDIGRRVADMLRRVGLPGAQDKRIDQLSGGQKQRVAIARSLVLEPTLLLLDEPLGALDLKLREHMKIELKQLQAEFGTTFVYITHDQSEALVLSDRVAVMNAGRFEQIGTPQELYFEPQSAFVAGFVGASNRFEGRIERADGGRASLRTGDGLTLIAQAQGELAPGDSALLFVRPERMAISRADRADELSGIEQTFSAHVTSLLFDGANSALLLRETATGAELRVTLPQAGRFDGLAVGSQVVVGFSPEHALAFKAAPAPAS